MQSKLSTASSEEPSGAKTFERDKWLKAFRQYLKENPDAEEILRRWQKSVFREDVKAGQCCYGIVRLFCLVD